MESQIQVITYEKESFGIKFARINKNNTLDEYKEEVYQKKDYQVCDVLIQQEIQVDQESFDKISNSLLVDNALWKGIGGFDGDKRITTKVVNKDTQEVFYVDTQGFSYARYVGI